MGYQRAGLNRLRTAVDATQLHRGLVVTHPRCTQAAQDRCMDQAAQAQAQNDGHYEKPWGQSFLVEKYQSTVS